MQPPNTPPADAAPSAAELAHPGAPRDSNATCKPQLRRVDAFRSGCSHPNDAEAQHRVSRRPLDAATCSGVHWLFPTKGLLCNMHDMLHGHSQVMNSDLLVPTLRSRSCVHLADHPLTDIDPHTPCKQSLSSLQRWVSWRRQFQAPNSSGGCTTLEPPKIGSFPVTLNAVSSAGQLCSLRPLLTAGSRLKRSLYSPLRTADCEHAAVQLCDTASGLRKTPGPFRSGISSRTWSCSTQSSVGNFWVAAAAKAFIPTPRSGCRKRHSTS